MHTHRASQHLQLVNDPLQRVGLLPIVHDFVRSFQQVQAHQQLRVLNGQRLGTFVTDQACDSLLRRLRANDEQQ